MRVILHSDITTIKKWKSVFEAAGITNEIVRPDLKQS
jgi:hypothetical protein